MIENGGKVMVISEQVVVNILRNVGLSWNSGEWKDGWPKDDMMILLLTDLMKI